MQSGAHVRSIQAITDFRNTLGEFCSETKQSFDGIKRDIRRFLEWLTERQRYWQRLAEGGDREAYDELQTVLYWRRTLEDFIDEQYKPQACRLSQWINGDIPKARLFLGEAVAKLENFINASNPSAESFGASLSTKVNSTTISPSTFSEASDTWQERGIQNLPVSDLWEQIDPSESHVKNSRDFNKVSYQEMVEGFHKLQEVILPALQNGADGNFFAQLDADQGLQYETGYERIYDAFYGGDAIRVNKTGDRYDIINGYHRLFVAKELGIEEIPVQVVEKVSQ